MRYLKNPLVLTPWAEHNTLNGNASHVLKVAEIPLRILNTQVTEQVPLMKMLRKCQVTQEDRRRTLNDVGNTLGQSHVTFNRRFKSEVDCWKVCVFICWKSATNKTDILCARICKSGQMSRRFVSKVLVFPKTKMQLKRQRFEDFTEIRAHLQAVLDSIVEWEFVRSFQLWDRNRCARYINSEGGYFDGNVRPNLLYI